MEHATSTTAKAYAARLALTRRIMAVAGHDLKQPLQIALISIDGAVRKGLCPLAERQLGIAREALTRLTHELDELARVSQADDRLVPRLLATPLLPLLAEVVDDGRGLAETCGVSLVFSAPDVAVETDRAMLKTILRNLVGNAVKYSARGASVRVSATLRRGRVVVDVSDDGCGIAEASLPRIFDAFERGGRTDVGGGLGLGLHIVRETAEILKLPVAVRSVE
ncbi:MAG: HAMP domain-containing sensor histidine kinase, partial [Hansschlegelia sp.]